MSSYLIAAGSCPACILITRALENYPGELCARLKNLLYVEDYATVSIREATVLSLRANNCRFNMLRTTLLDCGDVP